MPFNPIRTSRSRSGGSMLSLPDLEDRVAGLEEMASEFGAAEIPQDKPGVFARLIDVLSRPNYAIAGFVEEVAGEQPSVERGVKRALTEIFSGAFGAQGEKRAFGEVLENLGVGTVTLADAFPALEGTWVGHMGSRGAAGIALDIATDPLTYMTFGASGLRVATTKGVKHLSKEGGKEFNKILSRITREVVDPKDMAKDPIRWSKNMNKAKDLAEKEFEKRFMSGAIDETLFDKGGVKLFGGTIPGSDKLSGVPKALVESLPEPIARPVVNGALKFQRSTKRLVNGLFAPEGPLANLPPELREKASRVTQAFVRSSTAHRSYLLSEAQDALKAFRKLAKKDKKIGERWYDIREGIRPISDITDPDELAAFNRISELYDSMAKTLVEHGALPNDRVLSGYFFHSYKNTDDLAQYHPRGLFEPNVGADSRILQDRPFKTYREAQAESKRLHDQAVASIGKGEADRLYPILEPNFDVAENFERYVHEHASLLARKAMREEFAEMFGKNIDELIVPGIGRLDEIPEAKLEDILTGKSVQVIKPGEIEAAALDAFGPEGAQYIAIKSKLTGNEMVFLPKAVVDTMESFNAKLFNEKQYKEFAKLLKGFDKANNWFKWGAYTIWPASATRDAYSNIALSGLRIGMAALDPKRHIDAIKVLVGRNLDDVFANTGYTLREIRDMSKALGVYVPGQVFTEAVGNFRLKGVTNWLTQKRAGIENEARLLLFMEELRRGADPLSAANTVGKFLFNYGEVSRVEREIFRRFIPFYTFTRKNVALQAKMLRQNPGRVINQLKPFRGEREENEQMVKWEAEGLKLRMDKDGKTLHALTGIDLPLRNLDTLWRGDLGATSRGLFGMLTPLIKSPTEAMFGLDTFLNRDLTRQESAIVGMAIEHAPKGVRDWMGYSKKLDEAGRPRYTFDGVKFQLVFKSWIFSRLISTSDRQFRENILQGDPNFQRIILDIFTGIRRKDLNMDEQKARKLGRRVRELEKNLAKRGVYRRFQKYFEPKGFREDTEF